MGQARCGLSGRTDAEARVSQENRGVSQHTCYRFILTRSNTGNNPNPARPGGTMKRISIQLVVLSMLFLGCCAGVFAQATSQISGTVKDASGAVVAGAQITVTQTATGVTRTAM